MLGILWFFLWQSAGITASFYCFPEKRTAVRLWLGSVIGTLLSMWAPIPFAFFRGFGITAHIAAAIFGAALHVLWLAPRRKEALCPEDAKIDRPLPFLLVPFMILAVFLVWSHTLQNMDGALYTGQCTYGDMAMHLSFITSIAGQQTFPPEYNLLPGTPVSYPFLCDSVSSSLYLLGTPLRWAYMIPMFFAFAQVFCGVWFLAREFCRRKYAPVLAFLLFFLNGGLGMIYFLNGEYSLHDLFTAFYKTPTNLTEKGMRWVNVIADMLLPQRATLFGWAALFAVLYLLFRAVFRGDARLYLPAGILGGLLPMVHTHSYFALGLMAACWLIYSAVRDRLSREWLLGWLRFGLPAVLLALPQLFLWTFPSVGGNEHFVRVVIDWVNNGKEPWLWFWVKNVGLVFVLTPVALFGVSREQRAAFSGAIFIFVLCELLVFQPNEYDNNKLLYVAYAFGCFVCADALAGWLGKVRSPAAQGVLLALTLFISSNAAVFTLGREVASGFPQYGYELFSRDEVAAAEYIIDNTEPDAVFLTRDNHDNTVATLTGRNIVCGSGSYLYFHGLNYQDKQYLAEQMLTNPGVFEANRENEGLDYVYIGYHERALAGVITEYLTENYPVSFTAGAITIYDLHPES